MRSTFISFPRAYGITLNLTVNSEFATLERLLEVREQALWHKNRFEADVKNWRAMYEAASRELDEAIKKAQDS